MSKYKIKIGDVVKRISGSEEYLKIGKYYTISYISINGENIGVKEFRSKMVSLKYFIVINNLTNKPSWF